MALNRPFAENPGRDSYALGSQAIHCIEKEREPFIRHNPTEEQQTQRGTCCWRLSLDVMPGEVQVRVEQGAEAIGTHAPARKEALANSMAQSKDAVRLICGPQKERRSNRRTIAWMAFGIVHDAYIASPRTLDGRYDKRRPYMRHEINDGFGAVLLQPSHQIATQQWNPPCLRNRPVVGCKRINQKEPRAQMPEASDLLVLARERYGRLAVAIGNRGVCQIPQEARQTAPAPVHEHDPDAWHQSRRVAHAVGIAFRMVAFAMIDVVLERKSPFHQMQH